MKKNSRAETGVIFRAMRRADLPAALELWRNTEGLALTESDNVKSLATFLRRNPRLSSVASEDGKLIGAVLCSHDAWRGFLYHLAVKKNRRGLGVAKRLILRSLEKLGETGVLRCSIHVLSDNASGIEFWRRAGWTVRTNVQLLQLPVRRSAVKSARGAG